MSNNVEKVSPDLINFLDKKILEESSKIVDEKMDEIDDEESVIMSEYAPTTKLDTTNPPSTSASLSNEMLEKLNSKWDPMHSTDWDAQKPNMTCISRIKKDVTCIYENQQTHSGICLLPNENDITQLYAIVIGPDDTPYEGGFFQFLIRCGPDYPNEAPRTRLLTTSNGRIRFNPNLYANGKVCLSILGTWYGPRWSAAQGLDTLLVSIQSLLNEKPYCNEPAYTNCQNEEKINSYNEVKQYFTLRYGVCEMLENKDKLNEYLCEFIVKHFLKNKKRYLDLINKNMHLNDKDCTSKFGTHSGTLKFEYDNVLKRLKALIEKLELEFPAVESAAIKQESTMEANNVELKNNYLDKLKVDCSCGILNTCKDEDYLDISDIVNDDYDDEYEEEDDEDEDNLYDEDIDVKSNECENLRTNDNASTSSSIDKNNNSEAKI